MTLRETTTAEAQATLCATMLDEWVRSGVTHAVVSPGSRSTPMALAIAAEARLELHVVVDERSASFFALGMAKATKRPVILLCTSGTAAVEYHPAVVEADLDRVPLIVCTADRPKELHGIGAPQTVDQQQLYGRSVRMFLDLAVAEISLAGTWRSMASRIALASTTGPYGPGPVQANFCFREPLVASPVTLPSGRPNEAPWHTSITARVVAESEIAALLDRIEGKRGVIVAGAGGGAPSCMHGLAELLGWPVLADARSGARIAGTSTLVSNADSILRHDEWAANHRPEVVLRLGAPWASKVLNQWLAGVADDILVDPYSAWLDPNRISNTSVVSDPTTLCQSLQSLATSRASLRASGGKEFPLSPDWLDTWIAADVKATKVIQEHLDRATALETTTISEPALARSLAQLLPAGTALVVSSSMPIRDVEWFGGERSAVRISLGETTLLQSAITTLANRGANGIDGVLSTACGVAAVHPGPTVCLIGDLAFLHDIGALSIAAQGRVNATVVVVDNRGGGIFEFLPQATGVSRDRFELLYGTEQPVNLGDVARSFGLKVTEAACIGEALRAVINPPSGVQVVLVHTNRQINVEDHRLLNAAIIAAL
jgi:2-succinyl-5-enolpyruvyl-6-hydroxy-3-cyclohexene-1-carboxylate synthase